MILEALKRQAETERICAVDEKGKLLSFRDLHRRSDALASYFLEQLPPKAPVLLIGDKENDMLTCLFACMKSGRAYVPLTVTIPEKRAAFIAEDSDAVLIIAFNTDLLDDSKLPRFSEEDVDDIIRRYEDTSVSEKNWLKYDEMMALLYTSGSTGMPKGVINCLGDLENLFLAPEKYYIGGPGMRVMNNFSYMFSAHMQHVYRTMTIMGSVMYAVPGSITVRIQYASTELTTVAVGNSITKEDFDRINTDVIPVGEPVPSIEARLWDEEGKEVPDGEKGELIIISERLCDGYWKQNEQTSQSFFTLPDGRRGFHTRDLMIRRNGLLFYAGRLDNRIKIGGNRVELEEVESAIISLPLIHQCVVRPVYGSDDRVISLAAYVTQTNPSRSHLESIITIKKLLKEVLPSYMIPQKIIILPEFKTNTSGKIDRAAIRMYHEELMNGAKLMESRQL